MERIREEIRQGYWKDFPKLTQETAQIVPKEVFVFSETDGKGSLKEINDAFIGDIVRFGNYEQDGNEGNGKEAIAWYVLDTTDETMTLLSVKILDVISYSTEQEKTTWEDSEVRQWLNDKFYKAAFSDTEQNDILTTIVENAIGDTEDKVYLMSHQEFVSYFGVNAEALKDMPTVKENELRNLKNLEQLDSRIFAEGTKKALAGGLWFWTEETTLEYLKFQNVDYSGANGNSAWWLRTADANGPSAYTISANGDVDSLQYVDSTEGIRPVIRIQR